MKLSIFACSALAANLPVLSKDESSEILQRGARAMNNLHFEEVMPGNLERECIEEACDNQGWDFNKLYGVSANVGILKL